MDYPHKTRPGYLVYNPKTGQKGRTFHDRGMIKNKMPIYFETSPFIYAQIATLCNPDEWKIIGFID